MGQRLSSMVGPAKWAAVGALVTATGAGALYAWKREPAPQAAVLPPAPVVLPQREPVLLSQVAEKPRGVAAPADASGEPTVVASGLDETAVQPSRPASEQTSATQPQNPPQTQPGPEPMQEPKLQPKPAPAPKPATPAMKPTPRFINVNTASAAELELLPSIGPSLAKAIIDHRTKNGAFQSLADLDKVPGIGPKTLEKLKDRVTFR